MYKLIMLVKKQPHIEPEAFQHHWLHVHGPRLARAPGVRRYVQNHCLIGGYRKGEPIFDGIGEVWLDDPLSWRQAAFATGEDETARGHFSTTSFPVDVYVVKDGPAHPDGVKSFEFVTHKPGLDMDAFRRYWREVHGPLASHIPTFSRYEQNHTKPAAYKEQTPAFDGLATTWFGSVDEMRRSIGLAEYQATRDDEPNFLAEGELPFLITREHVLRED